MRGAVRSEWWPLLTLLTASAGCVGRLMGDPLPDAGVQPPPGATYELPPPLEGLVDITQPPYGADRTGATDVTAVINQAIQDRNANWGQPLLLYFPRGVYRVSDRIEWKAASGAWSCSVALWGESRTDTILRLDDGAPGYDDVSQPKAVVYTASKVEVSLGDNAKWNLDGSGVKGFFNGVFNLTVDTGASNPGAVAIDFQANNTGAVRNVTLSSADGAGYAGIRMERYGPGPAIIENVAVTGFGYALTSTPWDYIMTIEHLTVSGQTQAVFHLGQGNLAMRGVVSDNRVPVLASTQPGSSLVLVDSTFTREGAGDATPALSLDADTSLTLQHVEFPGYAQILSQGGAPVSVQSPVTFLSAPRPALPAGDSGDTLMLPVVETPDLFTPFDASSWAIVTDFGAVPGDASSDSAAVQAAIDSGAEVVWLPPSSYLFSETVILRGRTRLVMSWGSILRPTSDFSGGPLFRIESTVPAVELRGIGFSSVATDAFAVEHASPADLVLKDGGGSLITDPGSGRVFIDDGGGKLTLNAATTVFGRQLDPEFKTADAMVQNLGATLWVLGLKSEQPSTVIGTSGGGSTEVLGGLLYPTATVDATTPAFLATDSALSLKSIATTAYTKTGSYADVVTQTTDGSAQVFGSGLFRTRGYGSHVDHYEGRAP